MCLSTFEWLWKELQSFLLFPQRYHSASQRDVYQSTVIARLGDDGDVTKELFMSSVKRNQQLLPDLFMLSVKGAKSFCHFFVLFFVSMVQIV